MTNTHKHTHTPVDTAAAASTTTRTPSLGRFSGGSRQQIKHSVNHMTYWRLLQQIGVTIWRHYKRRQRRQRRRKTRRNSDKTQHQQQHTPPLHTHTHTRNKLNWNSNKPWQIGGKRIVRGSWRLVAAVASFNAPTSPCCCFCWNFFLCLRLSPTSFDIIVVVSLPKASLQRTRCTRWVERLPNSIIVCQANWDQHYGKDSSCSWCQKVYEYFKFIISLG